MLGQCVIQVHSSGHSSSSVYTSSVLIATQCTCSYTVSALKVALCTFFAAKRKLTAVHWSHGLHSVTFVRCTVYCKFCSLCKLTVYQYCSTWHKWSLYGAWPNQTWCIDTVQNTFNIATCPSDISRVTLRWHYNPTHGTSMHYNI